MALHRRLQRALLNLRISAEDFANVERVHLALQYELQDGVVEHLAVVDG